MDNHRHKIPYRYFGVPMTAAWVILFWLRSGTDSSSAFGAGQIIGSTIAGMFLAKIIETIVNRNRAPLST